MPLSQRLSLPIPEEFNEDWFDEFGDLVNQIDTSLFANRDQRNLLLNGGGAVDMTAGGLVTWQDDFQLYHGSTGFAGTIAANPGGTTLEDGEFIYVDLVRGPTGAYTPTPVVGSGAVTANDNVLILFARSGQYLWIYQQGVIDSLAPAFATGGRFQSGEKLIYPVSLTTSDTQGEGPLVMGRTRLRLSDHLYSDAASRIIQLRVEHQVSNPGLVADITLVDVTAAPVTVASFQSNDTQPNQQLIDISDDVVSLIDEQVYEFRAGLVVGPSYNPDDLVTVWSASIEIVNTF